MNRLDRAPTPLYSDLSSEWLKGIDSLTSVPPAMDTVALPSPERGSQLWASVSTGTGEESLPSVPPNLTAADGTPRDVPLRKHSHLLPQGLFLEVQKSHMHCLGKLTPVLRNVWLFDTQVSSPDFSENPSRAGGQSRCPKLGVSWDHSSLTAGQQERLASAADRGRGCPQTNSSNKPQPVPSSPAFRSHSLMHSDTHVRKLLRVHSFIHSLTLSASRHSFIPSLLHPGTHIQRVICSVEQTVKHLFIY